jgi:hypothetical protein
MRSWVWVAVAVLVIVAVGKVGGGGDPPGPPHEGQLTIGLNSITTFNTVTISPTDVQCGHYGDNYPGQYPDKSTNSLGLPNGTCSVGIYPATKIQDLPIKITYSGLQGHVFIESGDAMPANHGKPWWLCGPHNGEKSGCTGPGGEPGWYQFTVKNFAGSGLPPTTLTARPVCDYQFDNGSCSAVRKQSQQEGFDIIGPSGQNNPSTSWVLTITWIAVPPRR